MGKAKQFSSAAEFSKHAAQPAPVAHSGADYFHIKGAFIDTSAGAGDAGKPIKLNSSGLVDTTMIPLSLGVLTVQGLNVSKAAATVRDLKFQTSGVDRWIVRCDDAAESGGNAGSNFYLSARDDSGVNIAVPFYVIRAGAINNTLYLTTGLVGVATNQPRTRLDVRGQLVGAFGAMSSSGTLDWNDASNARGGSGYTLLTGDATNGPGGSGIYYHPFSFEYGTSKDGTGNLCQFAIPYARDVDVAAGIYMRGYYSGVGWGTWMKIISENASGNVGIGVSPAYRLDVRSDVTNCYIRSCTLQNIAAGLIIQRAESGGSYNDVWMLYMPASSKNLDLFDNAAGATLLRVYSGGGGLVVYNGAIQCSHTVPVLGLYENDAGTDQKRTEFYQQAAVLTGRFVNDTYTLASSFMEAYRNAATYTVKKVCLTPSSGYVVVGAQSDRIGSYGMLEAHYSGGHVRIGVYATHGSGNYVGGIELQGVNAGVAKTWIIDSRGGNDVPNDRLAIFRPGGAECFRIGATLGRVFQKVPNSAPTDGNIFTSGLTWYLDEGQTALKARIKYADGTTLRTAKLIINEFMAKAYRSADQTGATGWNKINLNAESFDPGGCFDSSTNYRYDVPETGYYLVTARAVISRSTGSDEDIQVGVYVNGALVSRGGGGERGASIGSSIQSCVHSDVLYLTAGQYVELYLYTGASDTVEGGSADLTSMTVIPLWLT